MGKRNVSQSPDNNNEEIENDIDESSTDSFRYELDEDLSTTNKMFLSESKNSSPDEEFQDVLEITCINYQEKN